MDRQIWTLLLNLEKITKKKNDQPLTRKVIQDALGCSVSEARYYHYALINRHIISGKADTLSSFEGEKVLIFNDVHIPFHDQSAISAMMEYADEFKPSDIIILGDLLDFYRCSRFMKKTGKHDINGELKLGKEFLSELRERHPNARIIFKEGNHEFHLERYILENAVEIADLLNDLLIQKLDLPKLNITYTRNFFRIGKLWFLHGHEKPSGSGAAEYITNVVFKYVLDHCIFGHWHRTQEKIFKRIDGSTIWVGANGYLGGPMDYAPLNNWNQGFATIIFNAKGNFRAKLHKIQDGVIY